jgi:hypothetical protein
MTEVEIANSTSDTLTVAHVHVVSLVSQSIDISDFMQQAQQKRIKYGTI